jgi:hypothetical protein
VNSGIVLGDTVTESDSPVACIRVQPRRTDSKDIEALWDANNDAKLQRRRPLVNKDKVIMLPCLKNFL